MKMEGNQTKPYKLFRTAFDGAPIGEPLAEADSEEELWKIHKRRADYRYAIFHNRKRIRPPERD